jgi:alpha-L-fucosidase
MKRSITNTFVTLLLIVNQPLFGQKYQPTWESIDSRAVPSWFEDAKFGIFIHWGLYSVPSYSPTGRDKVGIYDRYAEHYWRRLLSKSSTQKFFDEFHNRVYGPNFKYQDFANEFKAEFFDPDQWADRLKSSGAQYVVLTSKHHEGFALWPSSLSWNWNAVDVGPHRDLLGELTKSVQSKGMKMGYYYSLLEWYHPLYKSETINQYVDEHMIPQMKELVTRYKPDVFWTDGEWDYPSETLKSTQFLSWLYNESPVRELVVVNDRWGKETRSKHGGFYTTEYDLVNEGDASGKTFARPWEECRGMAGSFGYNRNEVLEDYSTSGELIKILIDKVARGGNLLLNIGPTADGRIPVIMQQRLADMGAWLNVNGEGIYGTRAWKGSPKVDKNTTVFFTTKGQDLYVITTKWMDNLTVNRVTAPTSVSLLGFKGPIKSSYKNGKLSVSAPTLTPETIPCQHAWVYKLTGAL